MDILQKEIKIDCSKHPNKIVKYLQTKEIKEKNNLFYCEFCQDDDDDYKASNYILIDRVLGTKPNSIIDKWLPLSDNSLHKKIKEYTKEKDNECSLALKIEALFESLKSEVLHSINEVKKKMMNHSQSLEQDQNSILQKYNELSQTNSLMKILNDSSTDNKEKENQYRKLIKQLECEKQKNSEIFENLIKKHEQNENLIDFETPNKIKCQIVNMINQINIFSLQKADFDQIYYEKINESQTNSQLLFDLISTKSNFCSQNFLKQIKQLFNQINPLIQRMSFNDVFIQNKSQIDFSELNDKQIEVISEFSQHFTKLQKKQQEQMNDMKTAKEIKEIMGILNQKANNLNEDFLKEFENYMIQSYPLLSKVNFDKIQKQNDYQQQPQRLLPIQNFNYKI